MYTVHSPTQAETEVKRSKFLAHLVPWRDFFSKRQELAAHHPKARHIAWAYRHMNEYDQIVEEASDDGEPKGCAGMPILVRLRGEKLVGCGVLVVRYFGGIKLGTGGMARAYGDAAGEVLSKAALVPYEKERTLRFRTAYAQVGRWEYEISAIDGLELFREFDGYGVEWVVRGGESGVARLREKLRRDRVDFSVE